MPSTHRRTRILYFFQGCFFRHTDGCHTRVCQTLELLRRCNCDITVYSYRNNRPWPWHAEDVSEFSRSYPQWRLVLEEDSAIRVRLSHLRTALNMFRPARKGMPIRFVVPGLTPQLDTLKQEKPFDFIFFNNASALTQINGIPEGRIILDMHDFAALETFRESLPTHAKPLLQLRKELSLLAIPDIIWCISFAEYIFTKELIQTASIRFVPPAVEFKEECEVVLDDTKYDLLFVGSNNRWNADALLRFLDSYETWADRRPFAVAGRVCEDQRVRERAERIEGLSLLGFQSDLAPLYRDSAATICPVEGTGTKIKIIESLAAKRPVFAPEGATRGLAPGYETCVFPLREANMKEVLSDRVTLRNASRAADAYSVTHGMNTLARMIMTDLQT